MVAGPAIYNELGMMRKRREEAEQREKAGKPSDKNNGGSGDVDVQVGRELGVGANRVRDAEFLYEGREKEGGGNTAASAGLPGGYRRTPAGLPESVPERPVLSH